MMKRLLAFAVALMMAATPVCAEWKEGLGPSKPYQGSPEVDLSQTMGYILLYPRAKMPAEHFCDVLQIYLPREDIVRGSGTIRLFDENGEVYAASFQDPEAVEIRELDETELNGLMWGGGRCIEINLPVSMTLGGKYYVTMEQGCFTAADGAVVSLGFSGNETWVPVLNGDFGISALHYTKGHEESTAPTIGAPLVSSPEEAAALAQEAAGDAGQAGGEVQVITENGQAPAGEEAAAPAAQPEGAQQEGAPQITVVGAAPEEETDAEPDVFDEEEFVEDTTGAAEEAADLPEANIQQTENGTQITIGGSKSGSAGPDADETAQNGDEASSGSKGEITTKPAVGDTVRFNLVLGGEAVSAVLYSENGSVLFDELEYKSSAEISGRIMSMPLSFGVVFMNANGDILDVETISR
jgi:hypothetical protein